MLVRSCIFAALLSLGTPLFAQYKSYSAWKPTNAAGVNYRWYVDDLNPPACTVQLQVPDPRQELPRIAISFRTRKGMRMTFSGLNMALNTRTGAERLLVGCAFVDRVEVVPNQRIQTIISGSIGGL